jgi:hypothetical protein
MKRVHLTAAAVAIATLLPAIASAARLGEAAVVLRDNAPIFEESDEPDIADHAKKGEIIAYFTGSIGSPTFMMTERDGRVKVMYLRGDDPQWKVFEVGWMNPGDLSNFTIDCECSRVKGCTPLTDHPSRFRAFSWTVCLRQSATAHAAQILAAEPTPSPTELADGKSSSPGKCTVDQTSR